MTHYDVIIIGGGPAGLSAALILGRCRRRVLVCDAERPRNAASQSLNGFLTRDAIPPMELRRIARDQLGKYDTVEFRHAEAADAARLSGGFAISLKDGVRVICRKLLLATGVVDHIPQIEGLAGLYGRSVFHCPYCDGWEFRDQPLGIYGRGEQGKGLALELTAWSRDLILLTDGDAELEGKDYDRLHQNRILVRTERIVALEGDEGILHRIRFEGCCEALERRALFLSTGQSQASELPARLGCQFTPKGAVATGTYEATNVPGLYVAGDASRNVQLSIVAAAEGAEAAFAINTELLKENLLKQERSMQAI